MTSLNLARYLHARASGATVAAACELSGIGPGEAELHERDIASGELELPHVRAPARESDTSTKERKMAEGTVAGDELRLLIERVERLEEERKGLADDIGDVFKEAKARGFDKPTMKRIIKLRKMEPHHRREAEALIDTYMSALGMTPIEQAIALAA